jgi:hypothetical protein
LCTDELKGRIIADDSLALFLLRFFRENTANPTLVRRIHHDNTSSFSCRDELSGKGCNFIGFV